MCRLCSLPICSMAEVDKPPPRLRIASHNTQGLNSQVKRRNIFQYYHNQKIDVILLQETHFPRSYNAKFIHPKYPTFFLATAEDKTKRVAILFSHNSKFTLQTEFKDQDGRFILLKGVLDDQLYSFVSYYAPNQGQAKFLYMFQKLEPLLEGTIVVGGDSNMVFDSGLDKQHPLGAQTTCPPKQSLRIAKLIHQQKLTDIWRELNPQT